MKKVTEGTKTEDKLMAAQRDIEINKGFIKKDEFTPNDTLFDNLKKFDVAKYIFLLRAKEELVLPLYKGSTLRGGFGITFHKICCVKKGISNCGFCTLKNKCAYAYIFETSPSPNSHRLRNLEEIPRPFVIEPPLETKTTYKKGEILEFNLVLIGRAIDYLPYFIFTFKELGGIGIGKHRGRYELLRCFNHKNDKIYDSSDEILNDTDSKIDIERQTNSFALKSGYLSISFFTPTRIKIKGDLVTEPEFHVLIKALLHRISALAYFHCGIEPDFNYKLLISEAEKIKIKSENLSWFDWERYSSRQDTRMKLGGFVGEVTYEGNFELFSPLLLLGEYTHVGKNCTFGLGKYQMLKKDWKNEKR